MTEHPLCKFLNKRVFIATKSGLFYTLVIHSISDGFISATDKYGTPLAINCDEVKTIEERENET